MLKTIRSMKYFPRSKEEEEQTGHVWLKSHYGNFCSRVLWNEEIVKFLKNRLRLQIPSPDGIWRWVKYMDNALLAPHTESLVLQRVGIKSQLKLGTVIPTMKQWRSSRVKSYGHVKLREGTEKGVEEEVVLGVVVKHYNQGLDAEDCVQTPYSIAYKLQKVVHEDSSRKYERE
ncbi:hypothetical protein IW261DRAFT_1416481 [Armillaria novae-zelandiae]|uniref:Uncharacterized protein n=1 Tax=Armillaria novae-zelandiae TaxID=153914 RepID=A0AA39UF28_9AGAR|nr:hypothetical protein IW261DRAFT_1416481 [Armillaria novae-zelandiae]